MESRIAIVSSGVLKTKKENEIDIQNNYFNVGAFALINILFSKGIACKLYHGNNVSPSDMLELLLCEEMLVQEYPLCISIPSVYAIGRTHDFCKLVKRSFPCIRIVAGGRGISGLDDGWIDKKLPYADTFIHGYADSLIEAIINHSQYQ